MSRLINRIRGKYLRNQILAQVPWRSTHANILGLGIPFQRGIPLNYRKGHNVVNKRGRNYVARVRERTNKLLSRPHKKYMGYDTSKNTQIG